MNKKYRCAGMNTIAGTDMRRPNVGGVSPCSHFGRIRWAIGPTCSLTSVRAPSIFSKRLRQLCTGQGGSSTSIVVHGGGWINVGAVRGFFGYHALCPTLQVLCHGDKLRGTGAIAHGCVGVVLFYLFFQILGKKGKERGKKTATTRNSRKQ